MNGDRLKGYISFALAFVSVLLLLSIVKLSSLSYNYDFHRAIEVERVVGIHENVQQVSKELIRQGALAGFADYDQKHDIPSCSHCPDHPCLPPEFATPDNICSSQCSACFREPEAIVESELYAIANFNKVRSHQFDPDFSVSTDLPLVSVELKEDPLAKNHLSVKNINFANNFNIYINSSKFNIYSTSIIEKGVTIESSGNN